MQPADSPRAIATIRRDGTAEVVIDGVPQHLRGSTLEQARAAVVGYLAHRAQPLGRPIEVDVDDPEGPLHLVVNPDGSLGETAATEVSEDTIPPAPQPEDVRSDEASWGPPDASSAATPNAPPQPEPAIEETAPPPVASWMRGAAGGDGRPRNQPVPQPAAAAAAQPAAAPQPAAQPQPAPQPRPAAQPAWSPAPAQQTQAAQQTQTPTQTPPAHQPYAPPEPASPWSQGSSQPAAPYQQPGPQPQPGPPLQPMPAQEMAWSPGPAEATMTRRQMRESFLRAEQVELPASRGFRGALTKIGIRTQPSAAEREERDDIHAVSQHWPGVRTIAVVNGKGGAGKALAADEPVLTPAGYRPIGDLVVGDEVIGSDGLPYPVLGVYPQGERDLYAVTFTDGTTIRADADHLWSVHPTWDRMRSASGERIMTTAELALAGVAVERPGHGTRHRFFVSVARPVKLPTADLPIDPYLLGILLGDGALSSGSISVSTADDEVLAAVAAALPAGMRVQHHGGYDYRLVRSAPAGANPLMDALRDLGLYGCRSEQEFVPSVYLVADLDARAALLQGLMDADGYADRSGAGVFVSTSRQLTADVKHLAETLGCVVTTGRPHRQGYRHNGARRLGQLAYQVRIAPTSDVPLFRLEREQSRVAARGRQPYRAIASIEPAGRGPAVCIKVASPDSLFLARSCVPTHNTPTTALLAATFARYSGAATIAWDNNETRGTLGWRTEQGKHENTVLELIPQAEELLHPGARAGDISHYVHHQAADKYDVLRSNPHLLSAEQRITAEDVDRIHDVLGRYYRLIFVDSGNDESAGHWLRMIDKADQLVVPTIARPEHAEAGALLLEELTRSGGRSAELAQRAVVIVSQSREKDVNPSAAEIARGFAGWVSGVVTIPYDRAMVENVLRFDALAPATRRAWLRAAAAVARQL